ncbi:hypothetical protein RchiOBHm_Chr2g0120551 [Rosa chinensis]|uniref:Uncharacterized protein n=1 Tax=Rosa chinensis TaxID=74649 RepID=A0A2P6RSC8_ROSCH|nr:hypothetical protein RchiOBHm_Chr2g0120551 [Rosa chinensis]
MIILSRDCQGRLYLDLNIVLLWVFGLICCLVVFRSSKYCSLKYLGVFALLNHLSFL